MNVYTVFKNPKRQWADQLTIYMQGAAKVLNLGQLEENPASSCVEDWNPGPLDHKPTALATQPHCAHKAV